MKEIDGSYCEGGGQIVRSAVALSAITRKDIHLFNIRAGREKPGLRPQHLEGISAAAKMCGAAVSGLKPGSTEIEFVPHAVKGGNYVVDIKTAGAVTLILQTLVPIALHANEPVELLIRGGTAVPYSPTTEYLEHVSSRLLTRMGVGINVQTEKHGFYPAGGGEVSAFIQPGIVHSVELIERGSLEKIEVISIAQRTLRNRRVAERTLDGFKTVLPDVDGECKYVDALSPGCFISSRAHFRNSSLGADELGRRGKRAEEVGEEAAANLKKGLATEAAIDSWMVDQIIPYLALAAHETGEASRVRIPGLSQHARTNMWVISAFLPVRFHEEKNILECFIKE
jgi:RNA 3'-terminal phosphate cyclase (ATP)